jgi:alpha-L-rhamnosidase
MISMFGAGLLFLSSACGAQDAPLVRLVNLTCESLVNPLGIDVTAPRLSWILQSDQRGQRQTAYQVLVASTAALLNQDQGDLWDSGQVASDQSIQVAYAGAPLTSHQACWWKVRVWDKDGQPTAWSDPASWSMGVLEPEDWAEAQWIGMEAGESQHPLEESLKTAHWIWYPEENPASSGKPGTVFFRKTFDAPGAEGAQALLLLAADNQARIFINGQRLGEWGDFKVANEFALSKHLRPGKNVLAVSVQNMGDNPNPAGLLALLHFNPASGATSASITDTSWKTNNATQHGWETPDFDDSAWVQAKDLGPYGMEPWKETRLQDARILPARMLRREFVVDQPVRRATVYLSGLGLSELYLNGNKVGDAVLSPGCTEYNKRVFYVTQEVAGGLLNGKNALGVWLGNGRYYAPRLTEPTTTRTYHYPKALLLLHLEMEDGSIQTVITDEQWKLTDEGPIRANNEYDGEVYDARMELTGWDQPGFDDAAWKPAQRVEVPGGVFSAEMIDPIRVVETLYPVAITNPQPGVYIYDMGQNMVGWCKFSVQGPRGAAVTLRHAETIKPDGSLYLDNIRGAKVTDVYTLKGEGVETYEPRFTYHGFRYVEMTGFPGEPSLNTLEGKVVHDDMTRAGSFTCSNKVLNDIYHNVYWGTRGNYRSMPTDCPQRDERQGWLGDRSEESRGESYLFDLSALYSKWVQDMEDAQLESGSVSDVCPSYWPLYNDNVTWPSSFIIIPNMLYDQYADTRTISGRYEGMKKWINHMLGYKKDGIIPKDNYGDWCVPPEEQHLIHSKDPARKTPGDFIATAYFCHDLNLMAHYAKLLGKTEDEADFKQKAEEMTAALNAKFFDAGKAQYANGTQTSCVLPLAFGLVPEGSREGVFNRLLDKIANETKGHIGTGLIGGQWLMRVLSDNGRPDIAYTMATMTDYPSWGYMIAHGATTIWELWNGDTADPGMNSHNHVMLVGDLNLWFHEYLAGIRRDQPGFKHLRLKPYPVGDLTHVNASHLTPHGAVFSEWKIDGDAFSWRVNVPPNTTATIYVPAASQDVVTESGQPASNIEGLQFVRMDDGAAVYEAASGRYDFTSTKFTRPGAK